MDLKNKVIVVTGSCGLLGREHVKAIASYGGIPVLIDLDQNIINDFSNEINEKYNINSCGFKVDITNEKLVKSNVTQIINKYGKIDGLVNNAANNPKIEQKENKNFSRLENFSIDNWENDLSVGLKGAFICTKHYGFQISKNKAGGSIVNISSDLGLIAPNQQIYKIKGLKDNLQPVKPVTYSVVKTGLIGLTRYVSTYWADKNVRCNAICPGGVENNQDPKFIKKLIKKIPLNRMARKDEYRELLVLLLSNSSSYINGSIISADGGRTTW
jgi:NAD(P)-dependent dehydrogenase (short-subunit alcohol dehydrogenase family)